MRRLPMDNAGLNAGFHINIDKLFMFGKRLCFIIKGVWGEKPRFSSFELNSPNAGIAWEDD